MSILMRAFAKMNEWLVSKMRGRKKFVAQSTALDFYLESDSYTAGLVDDLSELNKLSA
jgi:hypothetical protein